MKPAPNVTCISFVPSGQTSVLEGNWAYTLGGSEGGATIQGVRFSSIFFNNNVPTPSFGVQIMQQKQPSSKGKFRQHFTFPSELRGTSQGGVYAVVNATTIKVATRLPGLPGFPASVDDPSPNVTRLTLHRM
jgi:hypothetical protein